MPRFFNPAYLQFLSKLLLFFSAPLSPLGDGPLVGRVLEVVAEGSMVVGVARQAEEDQMGHQAYFSPPLVNMVPTYHNK